jgi:hypothetical protein
MMDRGDRDSEVLAKSLASVDRGGDKMTDEDVWPPALLKDITTYNLMHTILALFVSR